MVAIAALRRRARGYLQRYPEIVQTLAAFGVKLAGAATSFLFNFLIARHFGAVGTGGYALALTTATVTGTLSLFGLDYILLRTVAGDLKVGAIAEARGTVRTITRGVIGISLAMSVLLAIAGAPLLLQLVGHAEDAHILGFAAFGVLPFAMTRLAAAALRGSGGVVMAQWVDGPLATTMSLAGLIGIILFAGGTGVETLFIVYIATTVAAGAFAWLLYARKARRWPRAAAVPLPPLLGQSWKISLVVLSMLLADWVILLMLGANFSTAQIGQFRTAWQITSLIGLIVVTFDSVAGPRVAAAHRVGETQGIYRIWRQSVLVMVAMSAPLLVVTIFFPAWLLQFFGADFVPAAPALQVLALGQLVNIVTGPVGSILMMTGREVWSLRISAGAFVILVVLGLTLIPSFGLIGAALTTSLTMVFRNSAACAVVLRSLRRPG